MKKFAEVDEKGNIIADQENPETGFKVKDGADLEEFKKLREEFGSREVKFESRPWTLSVIGDMRLAAADFENLGPAFSEKEHQRGPGVPHLASV